MPNLIVLQVKMREVFAALDSSRNALQSLVRQIKRFDIIVACMSLRAAGKEQQHNKKEDYYFDVESHFLMFQQLP